MVVKYSDFGPINGYISETMQDRKSYMSFRLVPKLVTLNDLELHNGVIWRYFSEFE